MMERSEQIDALAVALTKAQGAFKPAQKSGKNPHLKNRYATLDDIIEAVRQPLCDNGLAFLQLLDSDGEGPALTTILLHESGQWLSAQVPINTMDAHRGTNDMQAFGATLTYLKRYALAAMLGVSSDEDVDGNSAATAIKPREQPSPPASTTSTTSGDRQSYWALYHREAKAAGVVQNHAKNIAQKYGESEGDWDKAMQRLVDAIVELTE